MGLTWGVLLALTVTAAHPGPSVKFIQPRVSFVLASPFGAEVPVQVRVEPRAANRAVVITWCTGKSVRQLAGADAAGVQPPERPIMARVYDGVCMFTAAVLAGDGKVLARAEFRVQVNGEK